MRQSRVMSLVETFANVGMGYALAVVAQMVVLPLFGIRVSLLDSLQAGLVFTVVSLRRGAALRRLFERLGMSP